MPRLPGHHLLALTRRIIDPVTVTRVLAPLVADWQREWLMADSSARRALVRGRGLAAFLTTAAYCVMTEPVPRSVRRRTWRLLLAFSTVGVLILTLPFLLGDTTLTASMLILLVPGSLALSLPFASLPLAMRLGGMRRHGPASAPHLIRVTMAIVALVFVLHDWVMPYANRAFRNSAFAIRAHHAVNGSRLPSLGARELTLPQLLSPRAARPYVIASERQLQEERHNRAALPLMPIALAMLGWNLRRANGNAGHLRITLWWMFIAATFGAARSLGMTFERAWHVPREIGIWLPLVLWALASVALMRASRGSLSNRSQPVQ